MSQCNVEEPRGKASGGRRGRDNGFFKMGCAGEPHGVSLRVICVEVRNASDPWADAARLALSAGYFSLKQYRCERSEMYMLPLATEGVL